jgi:hypothetical protein
MDVDSGACGKATKHEDGDYQIDETLLNNPPIKSKMTGLIPNHGLNRTCGRGSTTLRPGVSPNGVSGDSPLDPGSNNYRSEI